MLRSQLQITDQDARSISAVKGQEYHGQVAHTLDGRAYVYATAGASNLAAGKVNIPAATTANHVNQTGVAYPVGTTSLTYTIGGTATTLNQYGGGYLAINDTATTGINVYRIKSNTVSAGSALVTVTLFDDEPLTVATTTASKFSLYPSPYNFTVVATASSSLQANGVANVAVTATYSYWSQTAGYCAVLSDGVIAKNVAGILSPSLAGAVVTEGTSGVVQRIAYAPEATVDQKYYPLVLTIQQ